MKWPRTRDAGDTGVGHARPYALAMRSALPRLLPWIAVAWCLVGCAFLVGELHREVNDPGNSDYVALLDGGYILATGSHCLYCEDVQRSTAAHLLHTASSYGTAYFQPYVSPPLSAWIFQPLAGVGLNQGAGIAALISLTCLGVVALWAWRLLIGLLDRWRALLLFGLVILYVGAESAIVQWDYVLLALAVGALTLLHRGRKLEAGLLLGLMLMKPQDVWLVPVLLLAARQWRMLLGFACGGLVYVVSGLLIVGSAQMAQWLPYATHVHLKDAWQSLGIPSVIATVVGIGWGEAAAAALGMAVGVLAWRHRSRLRDPVAVISIGLIASLVFAPHVLWEDVILCAPGLLLYGVRRFWPAVGLAAGLNAGFFIDGYTPAQGAHALTIALVVALVAISRELLFTRAAEEPLRDQLVASPSAHRHLQRTA
ncbi:MAG: DUF2029 domain-containing protein [Chloroflexi bacterium]|nr:MAG: DUF2029 domain-containing protein [Chloroflexota bacterium]